MNSAPTNAETMTLLGRKADPALKLALRQAHRRFWGWRPWYHHYAWCKYWMDPCYPAIAAQIDADTDTLDLGTGLGMLPVLLGMWGGQRRCHGVEWDRKKVAWGQRASRGLDGISIVEGDMRDCELPASDVITLTDVLHYHPVDVQRAILQRSVAALRPGGRLIIREADGATHGTSRWTRAIERLSLRIGWNQGSQAYFRPLVDLQADLDELDLQVRSLPLAGPLHPGNALLVAVKPGGSV